MPPKPTTQLLKQLRALMVDKAYVTDPIQAYIVPSNDAHNSEYIAKCDEFRAYISGFTGSAGTAIITQDKACLWTDGRYWLQAEEQLDSNWTLMKEGMPTTYNEDLWLIKNLPKGSKVGVDPNLYSYTMWNTLQKSIDEANHKLVPVTKNLISVIWTDRPPRPTNPILPLERKYTGKSVGDKLKDIRKQMGDKNASHLVLTALDEIAWTLNLRGSDIEFNPVFFSFLVILEKSFVLFLNSAQQSDKINKFLKEEVQNDDFTIKKYDEIYGFLKQVVPKLEDKNVWFSDTANYALSSLIPKKLMLSQITPPSLMKAIKNEVEKEGMRNAHIRDGAALACYFLWLEKNVPSGTVTELSGSDLLEGYRKEQTDFIGPSFYTISAYGPHGAIVHYEPTEATNITIKTDSLYLCDSGGQYKDGTTDVTRTVHFGTPTEQQKEYFTRVLKGQIALARRVFPSKLKGNYLDSFARQYLWDVGLDYTHGTGHGIGSYLNVHEGPMGISWRPYPDDPGLNVGMFISNEPGYYEAGKFGIRIEDIVEVVPAVTPHNFNDRSSITFKTITYCPKQTKLIKTDMLTDEELAYINAYHQECREKVGPVLETLGRKEAKEWLWRETEPIKRN